MGTDVTEASPAFFRIEVQIISRSAQRSAVAAAAYRSGERLTQIATARVFDYQSRHGVRAAEIHYPDRSPRFASREALWNAVEQRETRADAQLARELLLSIPHELDEGQQLDLVRGFVRDELTPHGIVADIALHGPDRRGDLRNVHAHVMTTLRPLDESGRFGLKLRDLNAKSQLLEWRVAWERHVNRALERAQVPERANHRADLRPGGVPPEPKQGPFATELERRGRTTFAGDDRRRIRAERERAERRERESRRPRADGRSLRERVLETLRTISPLVMPAAAPPPTVIEHPARDRWREFSARINSPDYARHVAALQRGGWAITQTDEVTMFSRGKTKIENTGGRIRVHGRIDDAEIKATLDTAQANGWTTLTIRDGGRVDEKIALIHAALDRGIKVAAEGKNKALVNEVTRAYERGERASQIGDEAKSRATGRASAARAADEKTAGVANDAAGGLPPLSDDEVVIDETLRLLTKNSAIFTRTDLEKALSRFAPTDERAAELLAGARTSPEIIDLGPDERGNDRYTTRRMFALESRFLEDALAKARSRLPFTDEQLAQTRAKVLEANPSTTEHQAKAFEALTSGSKLVVLLGAAGAGKSFLMNLVREFYEDLGMSVHGDALAGVAADGLAEESGIADSRTTEQWRVYFEKFGNPAIPNSVHVGDEKGMAGTENLDGLLRKFDVTVLVGDVGQLQPISAGGALRALVDRLPKENVAELSEIRRQELTWQQEATKLFYSGRPRAALQLYRANDRFVARDTRDEAKAQIVADWARDAKEHPEQSRLVLAYTRADVLDLNERIRAVRREWGELSGPDVDLEMTGGKRTFAVGDRVLFREPTTLSVGGSDRKVRNGTPATIAAIDAEHGRLTLRVPKLDNALVTIDLTKYKSIDYADAATMHTAQGKTVGRAYFLATAQRGMGSDLAYVGMSRQKKDAHLYWSRDQFKNESQVMRVLTRLTPKDFSLDYSREAANMGLGVPNQAASSIATRAPYQVRTELLNVVRTAADLRESAPKSDLAAADKAYFAVRDWYYRVDQNLRELEAKGIRAIAIEGSATTLSDRLALLERSTATAVARSLDAQRGEVIERFDDLRDELKQLRGAIGEQRDRLRATLDEPAVSMVGRPDIVIQTELARLEADVRAAAPSDHERAQIAALEAAAKRRDPAAQSDLADLRADLHLREVTAVRALSAARERFADPAVVTAMQAEYQDRVDRYTAQSEAKAAAAALLGTLGRQEADLVAVDEQLQRLDGREDLSHEQLDQIAADLGDRRRAVSAVERGDAAPER